MLGSFSIANCYLFVMLFWAKTKVGLDLSPRLSAYFDRVSARPGVRAALASEGLD
ncbi:glutathione S-transferase [Sphingobium sp. AP50]|nr:glutathione S-transferase [Sphingobium sp. AP50]